MQRILAWIERLVVHLLGRWILRSRAKKWYSDIEAYQFSWKSTGSGDLRISLIYDPVWRKMKSALPPTIVEDVEGAERMFISPSDDRVQFNDIRASLLGSVDRLSEP